MKRRCIVETKKFSLTVDSFIKDRSLLAQDFEDFKVRLSTNPTEGDLVSGAGGIRKTRLKSAIKGKRGGFRICYYLIDEQYDEVFLLLVYKKNEQEDLSVEEKKILRHIATLIREEINEEK